MNWEVITTAVIASVIASMPAVGRAGWKAVTSDSKGKALTDGFASMATALEQARRTAEIGLMAEAEDRELDAYSYAVNPYARSDFYRKHRWVLVVDLAYVVAIGVFLLALTLLLTGTTAAQIFFACAALLAVASLYSFLFANIWADRNIRKVTRDMALTARDAVRDNSALA